MRIIDLPLIDWCDGLVERAHHFGIPRLWILRAIIFAMIASFVLEQIGGLDLWWSAIVGACCAMMQIGHEARLRRHGVRNYNAMQLAVRLAVVPFAVRLGFTIWDIWMFGRDFYLGGAQHYIDAVGEAAWVLWWYLSLTYESMGDPKHSWRELFTPRRASARGGA